MSSHNALKIYFENFKNRKIDAFKVRERQISYDITYVWNLKEK